jgi:TM2 domain-containing membrane protein YozV
LISPSDPDADPPAIDPFKVQPVPPSTKYCHACGAVIHARAEICPKCGVRQPAQASLVVGTGDVMTRTGKSKLAASLLAILLGIFGLHHFYLGDTKRGVIYLIFCWTVIPAIIGLIEGIIWLSQPDDVWLAKYGDR